MPPTPKVHPRRQPTRGAAKAPIEDTSSEVPSRKAAAENTEMAEEVAAASEQLRPEPPITRPVSEATSEPAFQTAQTSAQPTKRPVQRLASLNTRTQRLGAAGSRPAGGLKFQPKSFIRRSKEEREAEEHAEAERRQARLTAAGASSLSTAQRGGLNGRGAGRGNSGGGMNRGNANRYSGGQASGHLGGGTVGEHGRKKNRGLGSFFSGGASTSRSNDGPAVKREKDKDGDVVMGATGSRGRSTIKNEDLGGTYASSEDDFDTTEGPRVNIEHINLVSDDDTEEEKPGKLPQGGPKGLGREPKKHISGLKPIRIDRHEHVERAVGVNTEASSTTMADLRRKAKERALAEGGLFLSEDEPEAIRTSKSKGKGKAKDVEFVKDERRWQGVYPDEEDLSSIPWIKEEPQDDIDPMVVGDASNTEPPAPTVVETNLKQTTPKTSRKAGKAPLRRKRKLRRTDRAWTQRPVLQTAEDRQEWARYKEDLCILSEELGPLTTALPPSVPTGDSTNAAEGDVKADADVKIDAKKDRKQGLVYLFQLPPIMPSLITPDETEEEAEVAHVAEQPSSPPPKPGPSSMAPPPPNPFSASHKTDPKVKLDPDSKTALTSTSPTKTSLGKAGKLTVFASGWVMTTWGGVGMEVGRGGDGGILQEVALWEAGKNATEAMGQVAGGFVGVPKWGEMVK